MKLLTLTDVDRLIEAVPKTLRGTRDRILIRTLATTGLRCAEVLNLRVRDVDFERSTITVVKGKGRKTRVIAAPLETFYRLKQLCRRRRPTDHLFQTTTGHPLTTSQVRRFINRLGKNTLGRRVHPHLFRHSLACYLVDHGVDLRLVQMQLGHENLATTDRYICHLGDARLVRAIQGISWNTNPLP